MASDLIVPVVEVKNVRIHPNADMLSLCDVLGYQMVNGPSDTNGIDDYTEVCADHIVDVKRDSYIVAPL